MILIPKFPSWRTGKHVPSARYHEDHAMTEDIRQVRKSPFLTTKEAALFLRLHHRTLENWRTAGAGPKYRKHGGRIVYHQTELERFSDGCEHANGS